MTNNFNIDRLRALIGGDINTRRRRREKEHQLQVQCVKWFGHAHPELQGRLFAVPNGGRRDRATGAMLKAEGVVAGVADLILLKPNNTHGALLIEMKTAENNSRQSEAQRKWQKCVTSYDEYKYVVTRSFEAFVDAVETYLNQ